VPGFRFCGKCGQPVDAPAAAVDTGVSSDRRQVTVLFADLVGFSTLAEQLDPEELRSLITETFDALKAEIEHRGGTVEKFIGDAVVAIFGAPRAHEDDPDRAVETALKLMEVVSRRSLNTPSPLQLRIGVNSGLVVSGALGDGAPTGVLGDAVNVAARLQQAAGPGEVLVAATVWRRVRDRYELQRVGSLELKGRGERVDAYRVIGPRQPGTRLQAPFVGRREELALLELLWSSTAKGNTHVLSLIGEPGVGKSRLLSEFAAREGALDVRVTCDGERAFGPFLELIETILGRAPRDIDDLRRQAAALGVDADTAQLLATLFGLAGAPPVVMMADEQQKRQVFAGVWQFLLSASGRRPALLVLDDVHWADRSSLDLLGFLLERLGGAPLMLVLSYRPGFEQVERTALRASHTGIRLEPLTPDESVALAHGYLGVVGMPADLQRIVATRAEGNPFFIEELLQALLELGSLAVVDGKAVLATIEVDIPDTVQGTILARLDRLKPPERSLIQHAAVIGRSFSSDLIASVLGQGEDIGPSLEELSRAQLLVAQGPGQWSFKHALIQEVVYGTMLLRQRRDLHRKVAQALETRAGDDPAFLEALAEHYAKGEVSDKARHYSMAAGDLARDRMGFVEAQAKFETALRLWGQGDEEGRLALLVKLGHTAWVAGDPATARTALVEAEAGWTAMGNQRQAGAALAILGRAYWGTGESDRAAEALHRAIELLEPEGPSPELLRAFYVLSTQKMLTGQIDEGAALVTRGLEIERAVPNDAMRSHLLNTLGVCQLIGGDPTGMDRQREALELAVRSGEAEAIGRAYVNLPDSLSKWGRNREAVALARTGREVMRKLGAPGFEWFIASNEAQMLGDLGHYEDAEALCRECLGQRAVMSVPGRVSVGGILSLAWTRRGKYEQARQKLDETLPMARRLGGNEFFAPLLVREAELEQARGNLAAARGAIGEAVRIVLDTPSVWHVVEPIAAAAGLLARTETERLTARLKPYSQHPVFGSRLAEAEAIMSRDKSLFAKAADLYSELELPYQEARCRLEAGQLEPAAEIIKKLGLENGPLGARLNQLASQATKTDR
jgi:class 3 adenylate cyclase/tetratricopeptide (TPR) repeat protein